MPLIYLTEKEFLEELDMSEHTIYSDIARRTGGDIYIGVVGPVRSGKSTFIKRFMETLVLPNIKEGYERDRARDELPQSAGGKTVMTTEPKFIPDSAVTVEMGEGERMRVKMIDCVGYVVPDALGTIEEGQPRMVRTPWQDEPMPFLEAAELGTKKVINEHSTIGVLVSTDGSIGEIPRESYAPSEERIVKELRAIGKPFAIILNSAHPTDPQSIALGEQLEEKYGAPVALVNCLELDGEDIKNILQMILCEFPVTEVKVKLPEWIDEDVVVKGKVTSDKNSAAISVNSVKYDNVEVELKLDITFNASAEMPATPADVKDVVDLTEEDLEKVMEDFQSSKLGALIFGFSGDAYEDVYYAA